MSQRWTPALWAALALAAGVAQAQPRLVYSSLEAETAIEYQPGDARFGPGYVRVIGKAEVAFTEALTGKAVISPCAGPYSTEPEGVTQCSKEQLIETLTLNGSGSGYDFNLGRQIVTVGNTEGFVLLDRFNGRDFCRFVRLDTQNKLPNWLLQGRALMDDASLSVTLAPLAAVSELPDPNSYCADEFHNVGPFQDIADPDNDSIGDWAGGAELAMTRDSWGATLNVLSTREDLYVLAPVPLAEKTRPRTQWFGGTASATLGSIVVRGEIAYSPNRDFTLAPQSIGGLLMQGTATNGIDGRWNLLSSVGIEARMDDWYWAFQFFDDRVGDGPTLMRRDATQMLSLRARRPFFNERLTLDGFAVWDLDYSDAALRLALTYEIDDATKVEIGGTTYGDWGSEPGLFGSYAGRDSLYLKLGRVF